jgi:hypothetical protein
LENAGADSVEALLQSRWEVDPGPLDSVSVSYRTQAGVRMETPLIQPQRQASGSETYAGLAQPDGEWSIASRTGGPAIVNTFVKNQVARCFLNWTAKGENRAGFAIASERRTLRRGDRLTLIADYIVR